MGGSGCRSRRHATRLELPEGAGDSVGGRLGDHLDRSFCFGEDRVTNERV